MAVALSATSEFSKNIFSKVIVIKRIKFQSNRPQSTASAGIPKKYEDIPGPKSYPIINTLYKFLPGGSYHGLAGMELLKSIHKEYGDIVRIQSILGKNNAIFLYLPEHIEKVYRIESQYPVRAGMESLMYFRTKIRNDFFQSAPGLIVAYGKDWYDFRSKINVSMLQPRIVKLYTRVLDQVALDMVDRLKRRRNSENKINGNFGHEMNLWGLESTAAVALGTRIGCLQDNLPEEAMPNKLIKSVKDIAYLTHELDAKPSMWTIWPTEKYKKLMAAFDMQLNISQHYINEIIQSGGKDTVILEKGEQSILEKLLLIDNKVAIVMATDMMLAGVDTTSNTIIGILYHLAKNQAKQEKLRTAINEAFEKDLEVGSIPYLKACIKESMRLSPIFGMNTRITTNDIEVGGYHIPKETIMIFAHQFVAVSADQFMDPLQFVPERWLKEECDLKTDCTHAFANIPFGFGVRSCPGRRLAELELRLFLARLVTSFRIDWNGPPIKSATGLLNYFTAPFNFIFKDILV